MVMATLNCNFDFDFDTSRLTNKQSHENPLIEVDLKLTVNHQFMEAQSMILLPPPGKD